MKVLQQLADPRSSIEGVEKIITEYLSLLQGLLEDVAMPQSNAENQTPSSGEAKLRKIETFKWTQSICGNTAV